jgi:hypothetical protein
MARQTSSVFPLEIVKSDSRWDCRKNWKIDFDGKSGRKSELNKITQLLEMLELRSDHLKKKKLLYLTLLRN